MKLESTAFSNGELIPVLYSVDGAGISPPLRISDVPDGTRSLALVVEDPDIPRTRRPSGMFDHWTVWNLPADLLELATGATPPGEVGLSSYGTHDFVAPAPPAGGGEHRYYFYLYALDTKLDLLPSETTTKTDLYTAMTGHVVAVASLLGRYERVGTGVRGVLPVSSA